MGMGNTNNDLYFGTIYFPTGEPVPEVLTEEETIKFLRLDIDGPADPHQTLKYYRDEGLLRGTRISRKYLYQKKELLLFLDKVTNRTNRKTA
jgi:hypothetical protein